MKLLRLHFVTLHAMPSAQAVPLAAAFLTAYLTGRPDPSPVTVSSAEYFCGSDPELICAEILSAAPDLVAFPVYLWNRGECAELARRLRRQRPDLLLLAGGPEATADPARLLGEAPFDLLAIGEGERTLAELIDRLAAGEPLTGLAGTARLEAGTLVTVPRPPIDDLAELPSPYLLGLLDRHIANGMVWQLSRGCSFACDFCYDGMGDRRVRRFPLERLEQELDYLVSRNACQIFALDSTFNTDRKRAKDLLRLIRDRAPDVHFHFEVRHELLDREQAELFASLTCSLQIGLQSADPAVAGGVGRKFDRKDFAAKVMLLNDSGATFGFDLIYGLPGDRLDTFREGLDFALSLYPNHLDIFPLAVLPGTRVAQRAGEAGLVSLAEPPYTLQASATFPAADMARARAIGAACDIFYSRGKAVAWYNGVVRALKLAPVALLERFADWLTARQGANYDEAQFSDEQILGLQRDFLTDLFTERKLQKLLPAALDCAAYHYHYGVALMAVPPVPPTDEELDRLDLSALPLALAPSVSLTTFNYEILDLLESGEPDLPWIAKNLPRCGSWAAIYPAHGEVCTESLIEPYYRLLEQLDGHRSAGEIVASLGLDPDDTADFLTFALAEGIVTPADRTSSRTN
ncbi:B12-binding domain-containing radical SAM protein [Trichlorobacter ammonificans]|uniref:Radical SAM domain protein n=1 Tax=Trichlorobacter ammonificans TaxID=2916410 RepID=A0ABM9D479_9BACT|nr:radical SAM protein [Trichlorobacter ammonificans]CAH2030054.1 Radical SAM domain protein [Trichlorobacter ammonificans]